jgi:hypothetical protein
METEEQSLKRKLQMSPPKGKHVSKRYNLPDNYIIDEHGNAMPPPQNPPKKRKGQSRGSRSSSVSSLASGASMKSVVVTHNPKDNIQSNDPAKVKPVYVESGLIGLRNVFQHVKWNNGTPLLKISSRTRTQVTCNSASDKELLTKTLTDKAYQHFTFTERNKKDPMFILKGFPYTPCEELCAILKADSLEAKKVTFLHDFAEYPIYIVHFEKNVNLGWLSNVRAVDHVIVSWERFDRRSKRLTQCFKCQRFGHTSSNCGMKFRCVKCREDHLPKECLRKRPAKGEPDEGKPACVNCGGEHPANSSTCEAYVKYSEVVNRRRNHNQRVAASHVSHRLHQSAAWASPGQAASFFKAQSQSPPANVSHSMRPSQPTNVSSTMSGNPSDSQNRNGLSDFSHLASRLNAIPDIQETFSLFENLVTQLEKAPSQSHRLSILVKFGISNNGY